MQLVGVIVGTYSSIFFATPLLVTLRERTDFVRAHTRRVLNRRKAAAAKTGGEVGQPADEPEPSVPRWPPRRRGSSAPAVAPDKPAPGASRSVPTGRPSGKRNPRR